MTSIPPTEPIHLCSYASQPDLYIPCVRLWTTPFWWLERLPTLPSERHWAEDPNDAQRAWGVYTFEVNLVTCPECIRLIDAKKTQPEGM